MRIKKFDYELQFNWIDDSEFRNKLSGRVMVCKQKRKESQKEISKYLNIPLTKIKQIENGSSKDFNAINNYINYFNEPI